MDKLILGNTGLTVSRLCFGGIPFGNGFFFGPSCPRFHSPVIHISVDSKVICGRRKTPSLYLKCKSCNFSEGL